MSVNDARRQLCRGCATAHATVTQAGLRALLERVARASWDSDPPALRLSGWPTPTPKDRHVRCPRVLLGATQVDDSVDRWTSPEFGTVDVDLRQARPASATPGSLRHRDRFGLIAATVMPPCPSADVLHRVTAVADTNGGLATFPTWPPADEASTTQRSRRGWGAAGSAAHPEEVRALASGGDDAA